MPTKAPPSKLTAGPSRHVYDVIILGSQLGGALAAALLAKKSYRVLLVEHDGLGPGYEHDGFVLPFAPFLMPPLKALPALEEAFADLGLNTQLSRAMRPHAPDLQLILPEHRVDLHHDETRRLTDLGREFGTSAEPMNAAYKALAGFHEASDAFFKEQPEIPPDGLMETWALKSKIRKMPQLSAPLPTVADGFPASQLLKLVPFLTYLDAAEQPLAQARALSQVLAQPHRYPGGREGFREVICKKLSELGGDLLSPESHQGFIVEEMHFDGDRVEGIKLVQGENVYRATAFIAATDAGALRRLVTDKKRHRKLVELLDLSTTRRFLFTLNWVTRLEMLPRGMGDLLLLDAVDDLGPVLLQVQTPRRAGKSLEDESLRVVSAGAFVPASTRELGEEHMRGLAERLAARLDELMPFTRKHCLSVSSPYLDAAGMRGSRLLAHPLFSFEPGPERSLGIEGLNQRTGVRNLFLASREVLPGLGLEGELLAGIRAARLVQEAVRKLNPLK